VVSQRTSLGRLLGLAIVAGLVVTGLLMTWPAVRTWLTHQHAEAEILSARAVPVEEGGNRARITLLYRFTVGERDGVVLQQLAGRQADQHYQPIPDPQLPMDEAEAVVQAMTADDRRRTVWFKANDPERSAFILEEVGGRPGRRALTGAALVVVGLLWWSALRRRR
jgi:hypothetical protein